MLHGMLVSSVQVVTADKMAPWLFSVFALISFPRICCFASCFQQQQAVGSSVGCCMMWIRAGMSCVAGEAPRPLRLFTYHVQVFKLSICNNMALCKGSFLKTEQVMLKDCFPVFLSDELLQKVPTKNQKWEGGVHHTVGYGAAYP